MIECRRIGRRLADTRKDHDPLLPSGLIEYVQLSRSALVVKDPASDERFGQSRYLDDHRPKSVLCLPVVTQGKLVAVIYLENNLMENAFTGKHLKTLELLSAQAAISLVNAHLYESLERKVQARTEELQAQRNTLSKQIGELKAKGPAGQAEADSAMAHCGR